MCSCVARAYRPGKQMIQISVWKKMLLDFKRFFNRKTAAIKLFAQSARTKIKPVANFFFADAFNCDFSNEIVVHTYTPFHYAFA